MATVLARNWGMIAVRGVVALLFGIFAIARPGITLGALVIVFGAYAFVDGVFAVWAALANRRGQPHWVALLLLGLAGIVVGIATIMMPGITAMVLLYFIAAWAIIRGVTEIVMAIELRKVLTGEWLLALAGVVSVIFGGLLFMFPGTGALAIVLWMGVWAIVLGVMVLAFAFRLRQWGKTLDAAAPA